MGSVHTCFVETNINEEEALFFARIVIQYNSGVFIMHYHLVSVAVQFNLLFLGSKVKKIYRSPLALKYLC